MALRRWPQACVLAAALTFAYAAPAYAYDPFTEAALIKPADELEERLWDEAELMRGQFVRGKPTPAVETMQRLVRGVLMKTWPELTRKVRIYVIEQADVMAFTSANGDLYLSTGMLIRLDSEEELQVILAREIAHFTHRHTARTVYAARLGAGAKVIASTALDAADFATKVTTGLSAMDLAKSVASLSQELLLTSGKEILQDRLNRLKEMMADAFFRSMSVTGIGMMVKSSVFGFKDSLEEEADAYALAFIDQKHGNTDAYRRVMQRLYDEAVLDEKKFSLFYANEDKLADRLKAVKDFEENRSSHKPLQAFAPQPSKPVVSTEVKAQVVPDEAPVVVVAAAAASAPATAASEASEAGVEQNTEVAVPAPDVSLVVTPLVVASVDLSDAQVEAPVGGGDLAVPVALPEVVAVAQAPSVVPGPLTYEQALTPLMMPLFESELESGRYQRLARNIERPRQRVTLPDRARMVLAETYVAMPSATLQTRGLELAHNVLSHAPDNARMLRLLGDAAHRNGQLLEAKDYLNRALAVVGSDDEKGFIEQALRQIERKLTEVAK